MSGSWITPQGRTKALSYGLATGVNAVGTGLYYPFAMLFLGTRISGGLVAAGAAMTVAGLIALLLVAPCGRLIDRYGARPALAVSCGARALAMLGFFVAGPWWTFVALCVLVALGNRIEQAASPVLVMDVPADADTQRLLALSRALFNLGFGIGGILAGASLAFVSPSYDLFALLNAVSFAAAGALYLRVPVAGPTSPSPADAPPTVPTPAPARASGGEAGPSSSTPWRDRPFLGAVAASGLLWFVAMVVETGLPVHVVDGLGLPGWVVSGLFLLNTLILAGLQVRVSDRTRDVPAVRLTAIGTACYLPLLLIVAWQPASGTGTSPLAETLLFAAMALYSGGEIAVSVGLAAVVTRMCPPGAAGRYMAVHQVVLGVASALAPLLVGSATGSRHGPLWLAVAVAAVAAAVGVLRVQGRSSTADDVRPVAEGAPG